jgi:hypothetical protein
VVDQIKGPDAKGNFQVVLTDAVKLLDRVKLPVATDGKLTVALPATANTGFAQSAAASTILLATTAAQVDDAYNGMEVFITGGQGSGQRRVISDYDGITRTATVSAPWTTTPDSTSAYEVAPLSLTLSTGKGGQYTDPAVSGRQELVCIGDEVVRYTAKSGDTLTWPDGSYRAQFGTTRSAHKVNDAVQQCLAYVGDTATYVVKDLMTRGGMLLAQLDTTALTQAETDWYGPKALITACITAPETASDLIKDLLLDLNLLVCGRRLNSWCASR